MGHRSPEKFATSRSQQNILWKNWTHKIQLFETQLFIHYLFFQVGETCVQKRTALDFLSRQPEIWFESTTSSLPTSFIQFQSSLPNVTVRVRIVNMDVFAIYNHIYIFFGSSDPPPPFRAQIRAILTAFLRGSSWWRWFQGTLTENPWYWWLSMCILHMFCISNRRVSGSSFSSNSSGTFWHDSYCINMNETNIQILQEFAAFVPTNISTAHALLKDFGNSASNNVRRRLWRLC